MDTQKKWSRIMIGTVMVLILAVGVTAAFAQTGGDPVVTPPAAEDGGQLPPPPFAPGNRNGNGRPNFNGQRPDLASQEELLADALGISVEDLQAAQETAAQAALDQAIADGLITQEQADQMAQHGGRRGHGGAMGPNHEEFLADALGISVETLQAAQDEVHAAKLAEMVEAGVLTQEQADLMNARRAVNSYMDFEALRAVQQAAFEDAVQQALNNGDITQAQADQILSGANNFGPRGFDGPDGPGGFGGRGGQGHGGMRGGPRDGGPRGGGFPGFPGAAPENTANSNA